MKARRNDMRLYVIGDIHGQLDMLKAAHERIFSDGGKDAHIAHVGDLVDRGPDSRGVIEYLRQNIFAARPWIVVKGNHDRFLERFLTEPDWIDSCLAEPVHWTERPGLGAAATLASYGVDVALPRDKLFSAASRAVPSKHLAFLRGLPLWYEHPLAVVVHAGIRPEMAFKNQVENDLLWIRREFLEYEKSHGPLIIHGHTSIDTATHYGNRLNVDGGAGYGRPLCAVVLEDDNIWQLTGDGREPIARGATQAV